MLTRELPVADASGQQSLFDSSVPDSRRFKDRAPLARSSDPASSRIAADEITSSGLRASQKRAIIEALREQSQPVTSMELAHAARIDRYTVARRLPDLERDGAVSRGAMRTCSVSGRPAITWRSKEAS